MKRKILSILLTLVLVLSFSLVTAVPVAAVDPPEPTPDAIVLPFVLGVGAYEGVPASTAEWDEVTVHSGSSSVHLATAGSAGNEARILMDFSNAPEEEVLTLGDIEIISWWVSTKLGYSPHIDITMDVDGDGIVDPEDMLTAELSVNNTNYMHPPVPGLDEWRQTFEMTIADGFDQIDSTTIFWVTKMGAGTYDAPFGTLDEWRTTGGEQGTGPDTGDVIPLYTNDTPVLKLEIEVDNWIVQSEAYVDDITIKLVGIDPVLLCGQIQDAIDSVSGESPFIYVMPGTYPEYLHITTDGLTIEGAGIDQSIIDLDGLIPYWHYPGSGSFASRAGVLITGKGSTDEFGEPDEVVEGVTFRGFTVKNAGLNPPITATGTHTAADNAATLTDSTKSWVDDELIGQWVHNYGDRDTDYNPARSYGLITANTENTVTVASLSGGKENDWDTGDPYLITTYEEFHNKIWVHYPNYDGLRGIAIANGSNVLIQYCKVINNGYGGISSGYARLVSTHKYSEGITVDHCIVTDHLTSGISIGQHVGALTVTNNLVERNRRPNYEDATRENAGRGIEVSGTKNDGKASGLIADNIVNDNGFEGIILAKYTDGITVEDNLVTGHNLDEDGAGIFFYGDKSNPANCLNNIIRNNIVTGNIRGIVAYYAQVCTIEGNTITTDSGTFASGQAAIKIDGGNNITVKDNIISSCDGAGIKVQKTWDDVDCYANTFTGNTITGAKFAGVFISDGTHDNMFTNNTITGTTMLMRWEGKDNEDTQGDGVLIYDGAGVGNIFHSNDIYGNAGDGMENQTATVVDAESNWWGDASGPGGEGPGTGNGVSANINYNPWYNTSGLTTKTYYAGSGEDYTTIQSAIGSATDGDTVNVAVGTYPENITIDRTLTLEGAQAGEDPTVEGARAVPAEESTIQGSGGTAVTISADGVVITGFTITNPDGLSGVLTTDCSDLTIEDNIVTAIGNGDDDVKARGIVVTSLNLAVDNITIARNKISNITSGLRTGGSSTSAQGINVGQTNGDEDVTNLLIQGNVISDIDADTSPWLTTKGQGAYGILLSHGRAPAAGKTVDAQVLDNTISDLEGLWAHGIGLEGNTPGAVVERNDISHLTDHKWYLEGIPDAVAVQVEDNPSADTVGIHFNNFSDVLLGVWNKTETNPEVDATNNWWGTAIESQIAKMASGNVFYSPWLDAAYPDGVPTILLSLKAGWNLISLPLIPDVSAIATVLAGADVNKVAYYTGGPEGTWPSYNTTEPGTSDLEEMQDGKGYWIDMNTAGVLTISGYELCAPPPLAVPPSYDLVKGWNLIGFKSLETNIQAGDYLDELSTVMRAMYGYDAASSVYEIILGDTTLVPGKGYWLAVSADGTIYP